MMSKIGYTDLIFNISTIALNTYETEAVQFEQKFATGLQKKKKMNYSIL